MLFNLFFFGGVIDEFQIIPGILAFLDSLDIFVVLSFIIACVIIDVVLLRFSYTYKYPNIFVFLYNFIYDIIETQLTRKYAKEYFPYFFSLFLFLLFFNLISLFPFSEALTAQLWVTLSLSTVSFIAFNIIGFYLYGTQIFRLFVPIGVPKWVLPFIVLLEMISYLFRPLSLGIRLFANVVAGHVLFGILSGACWSLVGFSFSSLLGVLCIGSALTCLFILEFFIAALQAYVFVVLSCIYLKDLLFALEVH